MKTYNQLKTVIINKIHALNFSDITVPQTGDDNHKTVALKPNTFASCRSCGFTLPEIINEW